MTQTRSTPILADARRRRVAVAVALAALALVGAVAAAGTVTAQSDQPAVLVTDATMTADGTATVDVVLTTAPEGLAGYYLDVSVQNAEVARIDAATYPDRFGLTSEPQIDDDGATVTLEAADMEGAIEPGATGVTLATVELTGATPGEAELAVSPQQFDTDGGNAFDPATQPGVVTVSAPDSGTAPTTGDSDAATGPNADGESSDSTGRAADTAASGDGAADPTTADDGPLPTVLVPIAFAALLIAAYWRRE